MNFSYGVIAAVGVLVALSIGFIMSEPDYVIADHIIDEPAPAPDAAGGDAMGGNDADVVGEQPPVVLIPVGTSVPGCEADDSCYLPETLTVPIGTSVTWIVDDTAAHTVTSGSLESGIEGPVDSGLLPPGAEFVYVFDEPGQYEYFCLVHPWMQGVVVVE